LIVTLFALGMLASFARHEPAAAAVLRARGPSRMARILWLPAPPEPRPKSARVTRIGRTPERATGPAPRGRGSGRAGTVLPATGTDGRRTR
jgi:cell division protein FtsW